METTHLVRIPFRLNTIRFMLAHNSWRQPVALCGEFARPPDAHPVGRAGSRVPGSLPPRRRYRHLSTPTASLQGAHAVVPALADRRSSTRRPERPPTPWSGQSTASSATGPRATSHDDREIRLRQNHRCREHPIWLRDPAGGSPWEARPSRALARRALDWVVGVCGTTGRPFLMGNLRLGPPVRSRSARTEREPGRRR